MKLHTYHVLDCKKIYKNECSAMVSKKIQKRKSKHKNTRTISIEKCANPREPHGAYFCDHHSDTLLGMVVKKSTIPNAGYGLFATRAFKKEEIIDLYEGRVIKSKREGDELEKKNLATYFMESRNGDIIDSIETDSCYCRFANEPVLIKDINCYFDTKGPRVVCMRAYRDIEPGEELFAHYGDCYERKGYEMPQPEK